MRRGQQSERGAAGAVDQALATSRHGVDFSTARRSRKLSGEKTFPLRFVGLCAPCLVFLIVC